MQGVGEDLETAGEEIQETAEWGIRTDPERLNPISKVRNFSKTL